MLNSFQKNLESLVGKTKGKRFLLAVSGGIDSVVMMEMFRVLGLHYGVAHCNFQLRGKDSEADLKFVKKLACKNQAPFYSVSFDTMDYVKENKVSVQMAARELRYKWFDEICNPLSLQMGVKGYDFLVTAHHSDDSIETFFINLLRGTGISGLHGISAKNGNTIRPMLVFSRKEIELYAKKNKINWREDASNASDDYTRNKIRHHLLPALEKVHPDAKKALQRTMGLIASTGEIYQENVHRETAPFVKKNKSKVEIDLSLFAKLKNAPLYLFEVIKEFGFNYEQALLIEECVRKKDHSGKIFLSDTHRILIDRDYLAILALKSESVLQFHITPATKIIKAANFVCRVESFKKTKNYLPANSSDVACLDYDKLQFPLEIRKWSKGDRFYPLGMSMSKKVSDFLIDNKVAVADKEDALLLISNNEVAWVMGYRIDDRFKITEETKKIYLCKLTNSKNTRN